MFRPSTDCAIELKYTTSNHIIHLKILLRSVFSQVSPCLFQIVIDILARIFCMSGHVSHATDRVTADKCYTGVPLQNDCHFANNANDHNYFTDVTDEERPFSKLTDKNDQRWLHRLSSDIHEMKSHSAYAMAKQVKTEKQDQIVKEWRLVAVVLDRFFFFIFLVVMLVSVSTVFDFVLFGKDGNSSSD